MGLVSHSSGDRIIDLQRVIVMDSNHFNNRNNEMTTEETTELPHFVLENYLVDTQGLDEEDAWIRVLQNYDEIKLDYYEHLAIEYDHENRTKL